MPISAPPNPYKHHRFPAEIISHGVWWYFHFCLSYRDVEELLFASGQIMHKMRAESLAGSSGWPKNRVYPPPGISPSIPRYNRFPASHTVLFPKNSNSPEEHTRPGSKPPHAVMLTGEEVWCRAPWLHPGGRPRKSCSDFGSHERPACPSSL